MAAEQGDPGASNSVEVNLPLEIILMIGKYLDPGTSSLLNLARSCRALYGLLVPWLFSSMCIGTGYFSRYQKAFRSPQHSSLLPFGLGSVTMLDLLPDMTEEAELLGSLVRECPNVVELSCTFEAFIGFVLKSGGVVQRKLKVLRIQMSGSDDNGIDLTWTGAPNLEMLELNGSPNRHAITLSPIMLSPCRLTR